MSLPVPVPPRLPRLPAPAPTIGGILGWLVTQYGFDALMEWLQDRRINAPDVIDCEYQGPQGPIQEHQQTIEMLGECISEEEFAEHAELRNAERDEDY